MRTLAATLLLASPLWCGGVASADLESCELAAERAVEMVLWYEQAREIAITPKQRDLWRATLIAGFRMIEGSEGAPGCAHYLTLPDGELFDVVSVMYWTSELMRAEPWLDFPDPPAGTPAPPRRKPAVTSGPETAPPAAKFEKLETILRKVDDLKRRDARAGQ